MLFRSGDIFVSLRFTSSPNNLGLGPAFLESVPSSFYPSLTEDPLKHQKGIDLSRVCSSNTIRSWPVPSNEWIEWVNRVSKVKSTSWAEFGIIYAILLSQFRIPLDRHLFYLALMFWATSFNTFIFTCGPIVPTIVDISALLGLLPHG